MNLGGDEVQYKKFVCIIIIILLSFCFLIKIAPKFKPLKYAVEMPKVQYQDKDYIICKLVKTTGFKWRTLDGELISVIGCDPMDVFCSYGIEYGHNQFILYGEFSFDMYEFEGEFFRIFNCKDWDIIYPINRDLLFDYFMPKNYLCEFDKGKSKDSETGTVWDCWKSYVFKQF